MRISKPNLRNPQKKGQAMIEFALVFPILIVTILALIEFAFYLKDSLGVQYANLQAARTVAAEGTVPANDSAALLVISNGGLLSLNFDQVEYVEVYKAKSNTDDCPFNYNCGNGYPNGTVSLSMRYTWQYSATLGRKIWDLDTSAPNDWRPELRNDVLPTDTAGIHMKYKHFWVDPLLHSLTGSNGYVWIEKRTIMPIEPSCYADDAGFCHTGQG